MVFEIAVSQIKDDQLASPKSGGWRTERLGSGQYQRSFHKMKLSREHQFKNTIIYVSNQLIFLGTHANIYIHKSTNA